ncbi:MAG: TrkA family potassium uptake protein [Clostridia bacterium]|nr:TrkA family potassium uptake protein [Clostridia bacterium]
MKSVLLIGLGLFGQHTAQKLAEDKHEIMAIDKIEERVNSILPYVTGALIGDSTNRDFLDSLGVDNYDLCIVTIGDDFQASLETTSLLKELGAKTVVSRASSDIHEKFLLRNGADEVIYPEKQLAEWAATRYTSEHILDFIQIDSDHSIFELVVPESWYGKTILELNIRKKYNINIIAYKENGKINMTVSPDLVFSANHTVLVVGRDRDIERCFHI